MEKNFFVKSHGLGNEYIVLDDENIDFSLTSESIKTICDVHFGIGSDGVLLKVHSEKADFGLRIFNPDGSEAEKSGNGLRIFCKYLFDLGFTDKREFTVETKGGVVRARVEEVINGKARLITVDIGKATFKTEDIPVSIEKDECIGEKIVVDDREFEINCVSVGNPHCVIIVDKLDDEIVKKYGRLIENHRIFPNRTNVQFVKPVSRDQVEIRIWERGAGYTLASGTSSSAVAAVMVKRGITDRDVNVVMPGGILRISVDEEWNIRMTGEVQEICRGVLSDEIIEQFLSY
ncbi:MAG TPA: diaminopimelate epimerase [Persephonella sp.]|uniref:Diaminopimelate epimerase n=1 Tax=Persephonella marina (strain DSM 14350 / EX-H1) TaxID=123214 RepID=C0QQ59_PERMH|nr:MULTISPECIES: diaminopimelate epimerase [Persephonella]ACO03477.1 diaminopimelate epimerase [Persephonella marina EX-H1]HCB69580.1 diaminopimelate epimerase [Persephonella sp.]